MKLQLNLRNIQRKTIDLSRTSLVETSDLIAGHKLPLLVTPSMPDVDLAEWASANQEFIETTLLERGGILFRGFGLSSVTDFERAAAGVCRDLFRDYADLPQEGDSHRIYSSTPYPPNQVILFHNESSHLHQWPLKIAFFCARAADKGGETPNLDCRKLCQVLDAEVVDRFRQKGLTYVRNFSPGLDVSWQQFFHTTDRAVVDGVCDRAGVDWEWIGVDGLRVRQRCEAVMTHPKTGDQVFFNQVQLHHVSCLDPATRASLTKLFKEEQLPRNVLYGDGSVIENDVMDYLSEMYWRHCVRFTWQNGDLILLDNMLTAHARSTYEGPRKIMVAMGEMVGRTLS